MERKEENKKKRRRRNGKLQKYTCRHELSVLKKSQQS